MVVTSYLYSVSVLVSGNLLQTVLTNTYCFTDISVKAELNLVFVLSMT